MGRGVPLKNRKSRSAAAVSSRRRRSASARVRAASPALRMRSSPPPAEASRGAVAAAAGAVAAGLSAASRALPRFPENEYDYGYLHDFMKLDYVPHDCRAAVLGCGKGEEAVYFSERGYRVTGIDCDRNSIGLARERAWLNGRDIDFMIGNVFESASLLPAESFGLATDRGVFRRIQGERERRRYLELVRRLLLPGGVLLLSATLVDPTRRPKRRRRRRGQDDLLVEDGGEVMGEVLRAGLPIAGRRLYPLPAGFHEGGDGKAELLLYCRKT